MPAFDYLSNRKRHDITIAKKVPLSRGSIIAMDRGYNDYKLLAHWTNERIYFVTRLKENAEFMIIKRRKLPKNRNTLEDQPIRFNGYYANKLRRTVVWHYKNSREIVLLTNHLEFGAITISSVYKDRWQI